MIINSNKNQVSEKRSNGLFNKQERFDHYKKGTPGVGSYATQDSWYKKSHNIKYKKWFISSIIEFDSIWYRLLFIRMTIFMSLLHYQSYIN